CCSKAWAAASPGAPRSSTTDPGRPDCRARLSREQQDHPPPMTAFAFVFPGQGSQAVGMLDAWGDHPAVAATLQEASAALGEDIGALIHAGPKEQLDLTTNTQPVM